MKILHLEDNTLDAEMMLLQKAGFDVDVIWRKGSFAVLRADVKR